MITNGVYIDTWYVMIISLCLTQTLPVHFNRLFDCSKGHFNTQYTVIEGSCQVLSCSILHLKGK